MEIVAQVQEFHFESGTTTPYMSVPSSPKHFDDDFAFDFSGQLEKNGQPPVLTSADELFEQGKIRPLRPSPVPAFSPTISHSQKAETMAAKRSIDHFQTPISCSCKGGRGEGSWKLRIKNFVSKFTALPSPSPSSSEPELKKEGGGNGSRSSSFRSVNGNVPVRNKVGEEEMKKKTALSYRPSFFSCLRFSPALHSLAGRGW